MELALLELAPDPMTPPLPISPTPFDELLLPMGPPPPPLPLTPPNEDPPKLEGPVVEDAEDVDAALELDNAAAAVGNPLPTTPNEPPKARPRPPNEGNSEGSNV